MADSKQDPAPSSAPDPMRFKQGNLFFVFGVGHCLLMAFATLYSLRMFPQLSIGPRDWNHWYFMFFVSVYVMSAAAIVGQCLKTDVYLPRAILDALIGVVLFQLLFWAVRRILARWDLLPWLSLLPGIFLAWYGFRLRRGRSLWRGLDQD